ncbi:MAG TPA: cysteine peptidase family C39 domain-containing protein [Chthoniobacterales bacterium]
MQSAATLNRANKNFAQPGRGLRRLLPLGAALLVVAGLAAASRGYFELRTVPSSGGLFFPARYELPVAHFAQADDRWASQPLGQTDSTLGAEGCAVSCAAMVLRFYGTDVDPGRLNEFLIERAGYTAQGWLYWEKAAELQPAVHQHYENLPSQFLIDENLIRGNPVIVRVQLPRGLTHFVVITGKQGFDYLIQDPARPQQTAAYPLRELVPQADALRFYVR